MLLKASIDKYGSDFLISDEIEIRAFNPVTRHTLWSTYSSWMRALS